jgi:hypothetical protein
MKTLIAFFFALLSASIAHAEDETPFPFDVPALHEEASAAGLKHQYSGPWEYFVGGGVASFDCNGDRMPDLFLAGGAEPASLYINRSATSGPLRFAPGKLDLAARDATKVIGAYPADIDNDGTMDLVLLRLGQNLILKGGPDCSFTKANRLFSLNGGRAWTTAFTARWEEGAQFPTLVFGNYVDRAAPGSPWGTCHANEFIRPQTDKPDYSNSFAMEPGYCALSALFTDWNRSGTPSLRISNDRQYYRGGQEQLWRVPKSGFPRQYTAAQGWKSLKIWGMGIAEADIDQDGLPEYLLTSMGDSMLQKLDVSIEDERPVYRDLAFEKHATAHRPYSGDDSKPSTGWHAQFADFNNDSRLDLFIAKGNVESMPEFADFDPDNLLLAGADGTFHEKGDAVGIALNRKGRGAVVEDFNADGMLDLLVVNRGSNVSLFRNLGERRDWGYRPMGNWLKVELQNGEVNRNAVGGKISVKTGNLSQNRTIQIGGGHASGQAGFIHFGLGAAERAVVRVQWPDGDWSHAYQVFANHHVVIEKGKAAAQYWFAPPAD